MHEFGHVSETYRLAPALAQRFPSHGGWRGAAAGRGEHPWHLLRSVAGRSGDAEASGVRAPRLAHPCAAAARKSVARRRWLLSCVPRDVCWVALFCSSSSSVVMPPSGMAGGARRRQRRRWVATLGAWRLQEGKATRWSACHPRPCPLVARSPPCGMRASRLVRDLPSRRLRQARSRDKGISFGVERPFAAESPIDGTSGHPGRPLSTDVHYQGALESGLSSE